MRAPEASMSRPSTPGRKVSDGLALPFPSVRARSGSIGVGEVLDVRLATSIVLPRHLIGALLMRTQRSAREPGFIVSTTWTSHLAQGRREHAKSWGAHKVGLIPSLIDQNR